MVERPPIFFIKKSIIDKFLAVGLKELFLARNKAWDVPLGFDLGFGLWRL